MFYWAGGHTPIIGSRQRSGPGHRSLRPFPPGGHCRRARRHSGRRFHAIGRRFHPQPPAHSHRSALFRRPGRSCLAIVPGLTSHRLPPLHYSQFRALPATLIRLCPGRAGLAPPGIPGRFVLLSGWAPPARQQPRRLCPAPLALRALPIAVAAGNSGRGILRAVSIGAIGTRASPPSHAGSRRAWAFGPAAPAGPGIRAALRRAGPRADRQACFRLLRRLRARPGAAGSCRWLIIALNAGGGCRAAGPGPGIGPGIAFAGYTANAFAALYGCPPFAIRRHRRIRLALRPHYRAPGIAGHPGFAVRALLAASASPIYTAGFASFRQH